MRENTSLLKYLIFFKIIFLSESLIYKDIPSKCKNNAVHEQTELIWPLTYFLKSLLCEISFSSCVIVIREQREMMFSVSHELSRLNQNGRSFSCVVCMRKSNRPSFLFSKVKWNEKEWRKRFNRFSNGVRFIRTRHSKTHKNCQSIQCGK